MEDINSNAERVLLWLGANDDDNDLALKPIKFWPAQAISPQTRHSRSPHATSSHHPNHGLPNRLLGRDNFHHLDRRTRRMDAMPPMERPRHVSRSLPY